ncbi:hypothetical protein [Streptomyces sp. 4F14]|uniref:hypothetical protein n=1 Tax=Streptomyces sp. 4F14 TaxID=3394380 RepID=UPI003A858B62
MKIGKERPRMRGKWVGLLTVALAPLVVIAAPGSASAATTVCLQNFDGSQADIAGNGSTPDKTKSVITQQAKNTWDDWVWRGETFMCPTKIDECSQSWGKSHTSGWEFSAGLDIKVPIPFVGDLASITPQYGRHGSTTSSYTFEIHLKKGQKAQPIQVVQRRWTKGAFKGIYHSTGKSCLPSPGRPDGNAYLYRWDPNKVWGSWTTNLEVDNFASYNVYS